MKLDKYCIFTMICCMSLAACKKTPMPDPTPVASGENCYIVSDFTSPFAFKADVKGCSNTPLGKWDTAEVLWESKGTEEATSVGDIITITPDVNSQIITVNAKKNGNAVVAVKKDGKILWSWHIWACEGYNPDATAQKYNNNAGVVMDRNLGATSATPGKPQTIGLLYQWGRKDPFLSGGKCTYEGKTYSMAASTITDWPKPVTSDADCGTIEYAIENPTTFINCNEYNEDWFFTGDTTTDQTRWSGSAKTIYDPCPKGWMMMSGNTDGVWANAFNFHKYFDHIENDPIDQEKGGFEFGKSAATPLSQEASTWYPCGGLIDFHDGYLDLVGIGGYYWTGSIFYGGKELKSQSRSASMWIAAVVTPCSGAARSFGKNVRCVKIAVK